MNRRPIINYILLLLLVPLLLVACGTEAGNQQATTPTPKVAPTPTVPQVAKKVVHFTNIEDKIELAGWLYGSNSATTIICSHQSDGDKTDWNDAAPWLAASGFTVLAYDFRGHGDSQGTYDSSKLYRDVLAAIKFVQSQGAKKVILLGASIGGDASLKAAAETQVAGLIMLSGAFSAGELNIYPDEARKILAITAPKLIINSEGDDYTDSNKTLFEQLKEPKELHLYSGRTHGVRMFNEDYRQDLLTRILAFANKYAPPQ